MNKDDFKKEFSNFLKELDERTKELTTNIYDSNFYSTKQIGKDLLNFARKNFRDEYKLVYSTGNIRLDVIFTLGKKDGILHNASNYTNIERLFNAIKYQILANKNIYKDITFEEFIFVYCVYLTRLIRNFTWGATYNINNKAYYLPWRNDDKTNILGKYKIKELYTNIFIDNDNTVIDKNGQKKIINMKNTDYRTMKKLDKEQILELIRYFDHRPTVKELTEYYLTTIDGDDEKYLTVDSMRKYIKAYKLDDMIKSCTHSEKFLQKH